MATSTKALDIADRGSVAPHLSRKPLFAETLAQKQMDRPPPGGPSADWLRSLYGHVPDAVFVITSCHRISACNAAAIALLGYQEDELIGQKIDFVWSSTPGIRLKARWASQGAMRAGIASTKDGARFPAALTIVREQGFAAAILEDFRTEHETLQQVRELQSEMARLARTVALGDMTPALAHELSQPLSSILAYSQGCGHLVSDNGCEFAALREALSEITQHALWAATIVQSIRECAGRGAGEKRLESMHALIREAAALALSGLARKDLRVDFQLDAKSDAVIADRVQITQVLTNLLRNAAEAADGVQEPEITVTTRTSDRTRLVVEVSDNGCGIAAEIETTLFHPFVSSKPRGLGMGLALSKRIIEAHGGRITARRGLQGGSVLSFSLPIVEIGQNGKRPYDPSRR